jgi:hypothetical protein
MIFLLAATLCLQPAGGLLSLDMDDRSEIFVMPDGRMKHVMVWDVRDGAIALSDERKAVQVQNESIAKHVAIGKGRIAALPMASSRQPWGSRYQWTVFCSDIGAYRWFTEDGSDFRLQKTESGFHLTVATSGLESVESPGKRSTEVIVMPGKITSASGCGAVMGRKAITDLTDEDFWDLERGVDNKKIEAAQVAPRVIICGPSSVTEAEVNEFNKAFDAAMAGKAVK